MNQAVTTYIAKKVADLVLGRLAKALDRTDRRKGASLEERIEKHLRTVNNWSRACTTVGLGTPKNVDAQTVALALHTTPRRYRGRGTAAAHISEGDMLTDEASYVIIGDPGSGKTTTLKRLARHLLCQEPESDRDFLQYPILVELRSLELGESLVARVSDVLGLPIESVWVPHDKENKGGRGRRGRRKAAEPPGHYELHIAGRPAEEMLADVLSQTRAAVMIDGLDEVPYDKKAAVEKEIRNLGRHTTTCKIFVTCRSGDYRTNFDTFSTAEILPLEKSQIEHIASLWLEDTRPFLDSLSRTPYPDIVDRPLVLTFLLYLFTATGELPPQPSQIYRQVVHRLLKDWDEDRSIVRRSRYAHFDPDRKIEFLSQLSYYLTYTIGGKVFDRRDFAKAYENICASFDLPDQQMELVASEIETHTGLLYASGIGTFEFSHLSLQEYLCANYLVRTPHPDLLVNYFEDYPAPLAVACSLSSDSSKYFAELIKRQLLRVFREDRETDPRSPAQMLLPLFNTEALPSFLSRLRLESPAFRVDEDLGLTVLCLFALYFRRYTRAIDDLLAQLLKLRGVLPSVACALQSMTKPIYKVTEDLVGCDIDGWFASLYFEVYPPWKTAARELARLPQSLANREIAEIQRLETRARNKAPGRVPDFPVVIFPLVQASRMTGVKLNDLDRNPDFASRVRRRIIKPQLNAGAAGE